MIPTLKRIASATIPLLLLLLPQWLWGQKIERPPLFDQLLSQAGLVLFEPLDAGYHAYFWPENEYLNCHHAIRSRSEDIEIRYHVLPWDESDERSTAPHVATFQILTAIATNADDAVISAIQPDPNDLLEKFNADWGMVYFFQPKPAFSDQPACKMMALSRAGQGTIFIFFLFDDPGNMALDLREATAAFIDERH